MLFDRQEIGDHLGRMPLIRQAVPYRYTGIFRKIFDCFLAKATELDTIEHAAEYFSGIFNGFLFAQLNVIFPEIFRMRPKIDGSHCKSSSSTSGGFFEQKGNVFAFQITVRNISFLQILQMRRKINQILQFFPSEIFFRQ
ncbi:hypothetical protein SDC9_125530 [bioreactor metagenome]|uniref:Uncharacterized protein n=1 Tax=bioreactor metagenome TaxID=1076179 RepID=A0A645CNP9_9ZZZZ